MTERNTGGRDTESDGQLDQLLTDALRARPLGPDALARVRAATAHEWQLATGKGSHPVWARRGVWGSLVAALSIAALAALWYLLPVGDSAIFGSIARSDAGGVSVRFEIVRQRALRIGDALRTGDTLTTHGPALVTLSNGGTLRIAADTVMDVSGETEALLRRGRIYVDLPPGVTTNRPFRVVTRAGAVEHVGTQFEVLSDDQVVRVRVREGRVLLHGRTEELAADAGTELLAARGGVVSRRSISTYGGDWLWVAALAPEYEIEGRPLIGFLEWASRELGRPLKFADSNAREVAERTILHGSVRGREPLDALANVLATTSLSYEIRGDTIWIQSGHGT